MALNVQVLKRVFVHGSVKLQDPDRNMTPEEVLMFYSNQYPELVTSNVHGPEIKDDCAEYTFKTTVGTKG